MKGIPADTKYLDIVDATEDGGAIAPHMMVDTLLTAQRLLNLIDVSAPDVLASWDRIAAVAESQGLDLPGATKASGEHLTVELLVISLNGLMVNWFKGGAEQISPLCDRLLLFELDQTRYEVQLFEVIVAALEPLALAEHASDMAAIRADCCEGFRRAGMLAEQGGHLAEALAAFGTAVNMLAAGDPGALAASSDAARLARRLNDAVGLHEARLALATVAAAENGAVDWNVAFVAVERALRNLPAEGDLGRDPASAILKTLLAYPQLAPLRPWYGLTQPVPAEPLLEEALKGLTAFLPVIGDVDPQTYANSARRLGTFVNIIEDEYLRLHPQKTTQTAKAEWETWSFRHDGFLRAIPHGRSFLRERDLDQLILILNHELTHVYSMGSQVGQAVMALRATVMEHELTLWSYTEDSGRQVTHDEIFARGVAPLAPGNIAALAHAERALDASLKLRALQNAWTPWFEGIAVYAEHGADPTQDGDSHSAPMSVLTQLVDVILHEGEDDSTDLVRQRVIDHYQKIETIYSRAIERQALYRLRTYLDDDHHPHYLAGYLAVRRVVAAWRHTLDRALSGAEAARVLLHYTQHGTADALPDLGLPLDEFRRALTVNLEVWLNNAAAIPREDLEAILAPAEELRARGQLLKWGGGRLERRTPSANGFDDFLASTMKLVAQAFSSLAGARANPVRIADAADDPLCTAILQVVGETLTRIEPDERIVRLAITRHVRQLNTLVIGQVDAPVWLFPKLRAVAYHLRTTESHVDTGEAAYNGELRVLSQDEFDALQKEVLALREPRIRVTRTADLIPAGFVEERGFGRNYLVLQYGGWINIRPAGLASGSFDVPDSVRADIEARVAADRLSRLESEISANGRAGAARTLAWLQSATEWAIDRERIPVERWAEHVKRLADELLDAESGSEHSSATRTLLEFALAGAVPVQDVQEQGLRAIASEPGASLSACLRLLDASARAPVQQGAIADAGPKWQRLFEQGRHGWDVAARL